MRFNSSDLKELKKDIDILAASYTAGYLIGGAIITSLERKKKVTLRSIVEKYNKKDAQGLRSIVEKYNKKDAQGLRSIVEKYNEKDAQVLR